MDKDMKTCDQFKAIANTPKLDDSQVSELLDTLVDENTDVHTVVDWISHHDSDWTPGQVLEIYDNL